MSTSRPILFWLATFAAVGRFLRPNVERVIWVNVRRINPFAGPSQHREAVLDLIGTSNRAVKDHEST
jgi:hypothetical protein